MHFDDVVIIIFLKQISTPSLSPFELTVAVATITGNDATILCSVIILFLV